MASIKGPLKKPPKPRFLIRSLSLTPETDAVVQQLAQEASDQLGWTTVLSINGTENPVKR